MVVFVVVDIDVGICGGVGWGNGRSQTKRETHLQPSPSTEEHSSSLPSASLTEGERVQHRNEGES